MAGTTLCRDNNKTISCNAGVWTMTDETGVAIIREGVDSHAGDVTSTGGDVIAALAVSAGTTVTAGTNLVATAGSVLAATTITAGTGLRATSGGLTVTAGNTLLTLGNLTITNGAVLHTLGSHTIVAGSLNVTTGNVAVTTGNVTVTTGNVAVTTGNISTAAGNVSAGGATGCLTGVGAAGLAGVARIQCLEADPGAASMSIGQIVFYVSGHNLFVRNKALDGHDITRDLGLLA